MAAMPSHPSDVIDRVVIVVLLTLFAAVIVSAVIRLYQLIKAVRFDQKATRNDRLDAIERIFGIGERADEPSEVSGALISPDRAITSLAEDRIDRGLFVGELTRTIVSWRNQASLAIAITGPWGSGKTSTLNLVAESLRSETGDSIVIKVDPWSANRRNELVPDIYQQISLALMADHRRATRAGEMHMANISLKLAGAFLSLAMYYLDEGKRTALYRLGTDLGATVISPRSTVTLYEVQDGLASTLRLNAARLIICFDDIDRLDGREAAAFLKLVSTLRDLPYMLLVAALNLAQIQAPVHDERERGRTFIDKTFQLVVPLPPVPPVVLQGLWLESINAACDGELGTASPDHHLHRVLSTAVTLIRSLREVTRARNTFVHMRRTVGDRVALADIAGLSVLVEREPGILDELVNYRTALVGEPASVALSAPSREETKASIDILAAHFEPQERQAVRALLYELFPYAENNAERPPGQRHYDRSAWHRARRIADVQYFDLAVSHAATEFGGPALVEVYPLIRSAIDERRLDDIFEEYVRSGHGTQLLTTLQTETPQLDVGMAEAVASALLARSTEFFDERRDLVVKNRMRISWLLNELLRILPTSRRAELLRRFASTDQYPFVVFYIASQDDAQAIKEPDAQPVLPPDSVKSVQRALVRRLSDDAKSGRLFQRSYIRTEGLLPFLVQCFISWGEGEGSKATLRKTLGTDANFAEYLRCFIGFSSSAQADIVELNALIFGSIDSLRARASRFLSSYYFRQLGDTEQRLFEDLLSMVAQGESLQ